MSDWSGAEDEERAVVDAWVDAPVDEVWELWTTPAGLERWWWPMFDDARYEADARVGGWYRFGTASGGVGVQGRYVAVEEGRRLLFSWDWMAAEGQRAEQLVEVRLSERDGGTLVRVEQSAPLDEVDDIRDGWQDSLTRLEELADGW